MGIETGQDQRWRKCGERMKDAQFVWKELLDKWWWTENQDSGVLSLFPTIGLAGLCSNQSHLMCSVFSFPYRGHKLRILDLRHNSNCKTTCSHVRITFPFCLQSCISPQHAVLNLENTQPHARCLGIGNSRSEVEPAQETMELLVDISFNNTLRTQQFITFLCNKVEQSSGFLHLCCRDLQINRMFANKRILQILDLGCIDHLEMDQAYLSEIITLFSGMIHLYSLSLSNIPFRSFLIWLGQLENLQELRLSFFYLKDQLHKLLRWGGWEKSGFPGNLIVKKEGTILASSYTPSNLFLFSPQHRHCWEFEPSWGRMGYLMVRGRWV